MTFKNGKHSTVLCAQLFSLCKYGVSENNRSYLKNNWYIEENNRANLTGKIKSIVIGSGLVHGCPLPSEARKL